MGQFNDLLFTSFLALQYLADGFAVCLHQAGYLGDVISLGMQSLDRRLHGYLQHIKSPFGGAHQAPLRKIHRRLGGEFSPPKMGIFIMPVTN